MFHYQLNFGSSFLYAELQISGGGGGGGGGGTEDNPKFFFYFSVKTYVVTPH